MQVGPQNVYIRLKPICCENTDAKHMAYSTVGLLKTERRHTVQSKKLYFCSEIIFSDWKESPSEKLSLPVTVYTHNQCVNEQDSLLESKLLHQISFICYAKGETLSYVGRPTGQYTNFMLCVFAYPCKLGLFNEHGVLFDPSGHFIRYKWGTKSKWQRALGVSSSAGRGSNDLTDGLSSALFTLSLIALFI